MPRFRQTLDSPRGTLTSGLSGSGSRCRIAHFPQQKVALPPVLQAVLRTDYAGLPPLFLGRPHADWLLFVALLFCCGAAEQCDEFGADRRAKTGAGVPARAGAECAIVSRYDVIECRRGLRGVDLRLNKPGALSVLLIVQGDQSAQSGATALVPPITMLWPSTRTWYPVSGSASPQTSGTPRPPALPVGAGTLAFACQEGSAKTLLTPPPVAPSPLACSFHTTSDVILLPLPISLVPPQPRTCGLEAGKSTFCP